MLQFHPRIESQRLYMRLIKLDEAPLLKEAICETLDELHAWMDWGVIPFELSNAQIRLEHHIARFNTPCSTVRAYGVFDKKTDTLIGELSAHHIDYYKKSCELGYWMRKSFQKQGNMREAVGFFTHYLLATQGFKTVYIHCENGNDSSMRIPEFLGFEYQRILKNATINLISGKENDVHVYACDELNTIIKAHEYNRFE
ncbi:MAG: GNAT family N-acetyltransferase [Gammaproteobacteria bacterium]|nr:GNAT family N-acetyltransferase [Gammaproteobacteria bacterium]